MLELPVPIVFLLLIGVLCMAVYIRLNAVIFYGKVIHEFDPWFNFRATQYLVDNGWEKFSTWYDDQSWYPIGRPVGTTIYPGLMVTSAVIHRFLNDIGHEISLNDVCVFVPAGFGALATLFTYALAYEVSFSPTASLCAAAFMSIMPAHLMRSVAGGYDNECIAITAIVSTFYFWVRSLRTDSSWPIGILCGFSYIYMVAAWGGYTFVVNMIGVHGAALILTGRFTYKLHHSYTLWYLIGTAGAVQFPIVGWQPLQSLEQIGPLGVFGMMQLWMFLEICREKYNLSGKAFNDFRMSVFAGVALVAALAFAWGMQSGFLGPMSARVRGLFVPHTRTGNPLVDSVAEHQATPNDVYWKYFHFLCLLAPFGTVMMLHKLTDARFFVFLFSFISYYFSKKMIRLVLLLSPAAAIAGGVALAGLASWCAGQFTQGGEEEEKKSSEAKPAKGAKASGGKKKKEKETRDPMEAVFGPLKKLYDSLGPVRLVVAALLLAFFSWQSYDYVLHCREMSFALSEPQVMVRGRSRTGETVIIDDFREAYWWLRDNTPEDSRVMAWWDYGYQINGIGNRTSIADGNTWNHEHIGLLGRCLVLPEKESHKITKHLADYVLVWSTRYGGMWGDDLAKMPHVARIADSVFGDIGGNDFYLDRDGRPSDKMRRSLLYQLHSYRMDKLVAKPKYFEEAYSTKNMMVRIYKVKDAIKHPAGKYPKEIDSTLAKITAYKQH